MARQRNRQLLEELYTSQRLSKIQEKIQLHEANRQVLLEKLDEAEAKKIQKSINRMSELVTGIDGLDELKSAIKKASIEAAEILGGGGTGLMARLRQMVRGNIKPLAKVVAFENAIVAGFRQLPVILDIVTAGTGAGTGEVSPDGSVFDQLEPRELKTAQTLIKKAMGEPMRLFKSNRIPYIDDFDAFVNELLELPAKDFKALADKTRNIKPASDQDLTKKIAQQAQKNQGAAKDATEPGEDADAQQAVNDLMIAAPSRESKDALVQALTNAAKNNGKSVRVDLERLLQAVARQEAGFDGDDIKKISAALRKLTVEGKLRLGRRQLSLKASPGRRRSR